ncbi:MAG: hypothetical protein ACE5JU_21305 [Candidatus Binatia bacterium]
MRARQPPRRVASWLRKKRQTPEIGGAINDEEALFQPVSIGNSYDALIFIERISAARRVPTRR